MSSKARLLAERADLYSAESLMAVVVAVAVVAVVLCMDSMAVAEALIVVLGSDGKSISLRMG